MNVRADTLARLGYGVGHIKGIDLSDIGSRAYAWRFVSDLHESLEMNGHYNVGKSP